MEEACSHTDKAVNISFIYSEPTVLEEIVTNI